MYHIYLGIDLFKFFLTSIIIKYFLCFQYLKSVAMLSDLYKSQNS